MRRCPYPIAIAAVVAFGQLVGRPVLGAADGLKLLADLEYTESDSSIEDTETHEVTDSDSTRTSQTYHLDISQRLYPNLLLEVGGVMDTDFTKIATGTGTTESRQWTARPFVDLRLATPTIQAGTAYRKTEVKDTATGTPTVRNFLDEYTGELNLRPADLPQVSMNYTRLQARDEPETSDSVNELFTLRSRYQWRELALNYDHSRATNEERIADASSTTQVDSGQMSYGHGFLDDRLAVSFGGRVDRSVVTTGGSGAILLPTATPGSPFVFSGAAAAISDPLSLTPDDFQPFVVGSNAVNIGRSGGLVPVGIGLDFGFATEASTLRVPIRPDDTVPNLMGQVAAIAGSFTWRLFVSDDQEDWHEASIAAVAFDMIFGRFEITFAEPQNAQFLHLVVTPTLIPTAPTTIYIAGLQALRTLPGGTGAKLESLGQNYNLRAQYRVSDRTTAGYDLNYQRLESSPGDHRREILNNGVNGQHRFNDIYTGSARLVQSETRETDREDESSTYLTTALRGIYLPTFSQTLTYGAVYRQEAEGRSHTHSLVLRNNAELYEGWSMNLDLGGSRGESAEGESLGSRFVRLGTHLVPNRKTNLDFNYAATWSARSGQETHLRQEGAAQLFVVPLPTLSLFAGVTVEDDEAREGPVDVLQNYSVGWLPFPDGTLQFSVAYGEILRSDGEETKSFSPTVRWQVFTGTQVTVQYSSGTIKTVDEVRDFTTLTANLRLIY